MVIDYDRLTKLERSTLVELNYPGMAALARREQELRERFAKKEESTVYEDRIEEFVDDVVVEVNTTVAEVVQDAASALTAELWDEIQWLEDELQQFDDELNDTVNFYEDRLTEKEDRIAELEFDLTAAGDGVAYDWEGEVRWLEDELQDAAFIIRDLEDENKALRDEVEDLRFGW